MLSESFPSPKGNLAPILLQCNALTVELSGKTVNKSTKHDNACTIMIFSAQFLFRDRPWSWGGRGVTVTSSGQLMRNPRDLISQTHLVLLLFTLKGKMLSVPF